MPDWEIKAYDDLKKIPEIRIEPERVAHLEYSQRIDADLKHRIKKLRRMKLLKGDELTDLGRQFVAHCLQHFVKYNGKLALSFDLGPDSYPEVEEERTTYGSSPPGYYYELLTEACDTVRSNVFEGCSFLEDDKRLDDALDQFSRFGSYYHRRNRQGQDVRHHSPGWDCPGGNGAWANTQFLVSDYEWEHFDDVTENMAWAPEYLDQYETRAEAFADVYYELWALYVWSVWFELTTSGDEIMYQWRWNLASGYESRLEEVSERLCLNAIWESLESKEYGGFGPVDDPKEWGAESNEKFEYLEPYTAELERLADDLEHAIAREMRKLGFIVVKSDGIYRVATNNGEGLDHAPFQAMVKAALTESKPSATTVDCQDARDWRAQVINTLNAKPADKPQALSAVPFPKPKGEQK